MINFILNSRLFLFVNNGKNKTIRSYRKSYRFYQAGGCCEGTQPQCFEKGGFYLRFGDVCIGTIQGFEFWVDKDLFEYWKHAHFTLDVTDGIGAGGFSLETPYGKTFKVNYRLFTEEEVQNLEKIRLNE